MPSTDPSSRVYWGERVLEDLAKLSRDKQIAYLSDLLDSVLETAADRALVYAVPGRYFSPARLQETIRELHMFTPVSSDTELVERFLERTQELPDEGWVRACALDLVAAVRHSMDVACKACTFVRTKEGANK